MSDRTKRRRLNSNGKSNADPQRASNHFHSMPLAALAESEKACWHGFCEIESEPALFNVMLKDFGVQGVKVQEVVSLDDDMMEFIHKPIYGLIFLFRWKEDDPVKQEQSCPDGVWFANQTVSYACASVALLNIINNIDEIDLGEQLQQFKDFTMPFTPALRGDAIGNFEFVKRIHNSFARKMDVLNIDLQLKSEATRKKSKAKQKVSAYDESEAGFHFIAFVPAKGRVWKFDGLERQPQSLGAFTNVDKWLDVAKPEIISKMAAYEEDQIEFSMLSLVKDPMVELVARLAGNVKSLSAIDDLLSKAGVADPERQSLPLSDGTVYGPDSSFNLTQEIIDHASIPEIEMSKFQSATCEELRQYRLDIAAEQPGIRASIGEEQQSQRADENYAAGRRHDYGPAVHTWVRMLARKGVAETLVQEITATG